LIDKLPVNLIACYEKSSFASYRLKGYGYLPHPACHQSSALPTPKRIGLFKIVNNNAQILAFGAIKFSKEADSIKKFSVQFLKISTN
jgi:hypothetical protein